ncbi:MAG: hypothetical protein L3J14_07915 [Flavobacteriaceae bacterium]|nr:hypothetical protein [Flavobacteriaceae bacterium]
MNPILRNILAVFIGWFGGSAINLGLINLGHKVFPIAGIDINDMTAFAEVMPTLDGKYFLFPFLAHALGTLVGAFIAYKIAATHKKKFALGIGVLFLLGGIAVNYMLPVPTWFAVADIALAYIPMALIGGKLAEN